MSLNEIKDLCYKNCVLQNFTRSYQNMKYTYFNYEVCLYYITEELNVHILQFDVSEH